LDVILSGGSVERFERKVRRKSPSDEIGNGRGKRIDKVEECYNEDAANDSIRFGDLGALFKCV
jgi:hypothetical protein